MATKPNYLPNWNNVTPVAPLTKKKNETPVLPAVPVKLGSPVLPSVPVKLATPVLPPVVKKNETPVLSPTVNVNRADAEFKPTEFVKKFNVGYPYTQTSWGGATNWDDLTDLDSFWEGSDVTKPGVIDGSDMIKLEKDIKKRGVREPVLVDWNTKEVLNGHHRIVAARNVGATIPVVYVGKPKK